jgi:transketolase
MIYSTFEEMSRELRKKTFIAFAEHGEAHLGGSFSIIEILIALYYATLKKEDKFILSKSHASFPLILLLRGMGLSPKLTTHLEMDPDNGVHATTGSLGHGFPIAVGMAMARKKLGIQGNIFVLISDGECQEGTTWESLLIAAKHELNNLVLLVDYNKIQALSKIDDVLPLHDLRKKFEAFNWL